jgi:SAM-dependent methyltransferase
LVLDAACGAGLFSRRMAQLGARVVAFDFSEKFIQRARERMKEHTDRIEYRVADATDEAQLLQWGERRFDAAVCTMGLMDMTTIDPLMSALSRLLKVGGRFVFSVMHPCFNQMGCRMTVEEEYRDGELVPVHAVKVMSYIRSAKDKGLGIVGQPVPQYYFHRPISALFDTCFRVGFVLDGMEEPVFDLAADGTRPFSWANYREIPPALIARMRLL